MGLWESGKPCRPGLRYDAGMEQGIKGRLLNTKVQEDEMLSGSELGAEVDMGGKTLKTIGWVSVGVGAVALGVAIGRELRLRYKFNRRTPYDYYSHAGDSMPDVDYGVGI
ncbi:MAG: hypothetical protein ACYC46_00945 [Acidobacteriaceae bacterium]